MSPDPDPVVADHPEALRYEAKVGATLAGYAQYRARPDLIAFTHTEVRERFEGQGLGSRLIAFALDDARERGLAVLPFCPFVNSYIQRHPEYADLVPAAYRRSFDLPRLQEDDAGGRGAAGEEIGLRPIGRVESPLRELGAAPKQGDEGAPDAWLAIEPPFAAALEGIDAGEDLLVLTWLDRADRDLLAVHPRGDLSRPLLGVFATRSPGRPNPIGLHRVRVVEVDAQRLLVAGLEALDATPILDLKPVLAADRDAR